MKNAGFTLIEVIITVFILSSVMMVIYYVEMAVVRASVHQETTMTLRDEARLGLQYMTRVLRGAEKTSLQAPDKNGELAALGDGVASTLRFQVVEDSDGNGVALNAEYELELSPPVAFVIDETDSNGDGLTDTQLVHVDEEGNVIHVISSHLREDGGISFQSVSGGIQITMCLVDDGGGVRSPTSAKVGVVVMPRN